MIRQLAEGPSPLGNRRNRDQLRPATALADSAMRKPTSTLHHKPSAKVSTAGVHGQQEQAVG